MPHFVITRDTDGGNRRSFKSVAGALKRFESMSGRTLQSALDERFFDPETFAGTMPAEQWLASTGPKCIQVVSDFGCVVTLTLDARGF